MTQLESGAGKREVEKSRLASVGAALDATYGALARRSSEPLRPARSAQQPRRCQVCGIAEGFDKRLHCACDIVSRLLFHFLSGVRSGRGYRRDYQGFRELDGVSLFWDNATVRREVDDYEVVPGAYDLDLKLNRFLDGDGIACIDRVLSERLYPAFVETDREQSEDESGTHIHVSVNFLNGR